MFMILHALEFYKVFIKEEMILQKQIIKIGHEGEISKVSFNPQGTKIITAGADSTARIWSADTGEEVQVLKGANIFHKKIFVVFFLF